MHILDIPFELLPAPAATPLKPFDLPALPHGELESLFVGYPLFGSSTRSGFERIAVASQAPHIHPLSAALVPSLYSKLETGNSNPGCIYQTSSQRPCPRPVIHFADKEAPEDYCAAHLAWLERVEEEWDVPYPDSPQALLDLLAHATAQVLTQKMTSDRAQLIIQFARAIERQLRWI
jgi:hypothetical protein